MLVVSMDLEIYDFTNAILHSLLFSPSSSFVYDFCNDFFLSRLSPFYHTDNGSITRRKNKKGPCLLCAGMREQGLTYMVQQSGKYMYV